MTSDLRSVQRQLRELIVAPNGVAHALAERGESAVSALAAAVRSDERLSAAERLEVYANAYFYRIRDSLIDDFGVLHAVLGDAQFHNLITAYLLACPPRHPSLRVVGDRLADFIRNDPTAARHCDGLHWLADLAELEWALLRAFDAADSEALPHDRLAAIDPSKWGELRFEFQPALTRLNLRFTVDRVRSAWDGEEPLGAARADISSIAAGHHPLLIWRTAERVFYRPLDTLEEAGLDAVIAGENFGALCERLASKLGDDAAPHRAAALLARWQADGLIRDLTAEHAMGSR